MPSEREVTKIVPSVEVPEGNGVTVRRSIGRGQLPHLDPFLMLDEARAKYPAGFPDHPHRGFETVSYNLKGSIRHEDCEGNSGTLEPGDLQWMTAGRGVLHSEVPVGKEEVHGLQMWINLAAKDKMVSPAYQDLKGNEIPAKTADGVTVKIIAGESMGVKSPVRTRTPAFCLHFLMAPGSHHSQAVPEEWNCFCYVLEGTATVGSNKPTDVPAHTLAVFSHGTTIKLVNMGLSELSFILVGGQPIKEPVARRGPFVMNTQEEINEAFEDFYEGKNGFEKARNWVSKFGSKTRNM